MLDALDAFSGLAEVLGYFLSFWAFWFSPSHRARVWQEFLEVGLLRKGLKIVEATIATVLGIGPALLIGLLIYWLN